MPTLEQELLQLPQEGQYIPGCSPVCALPLQEDTKASGRDRGWDIIRGIGKNREGDEGSAALTKA